ncbi:glycoside hydrolase family 65 protein [Ruegeria sp. HKCCD8929]|uniref:glycoside hydrolase family 65 protein n=1 Tax=Ruegeria sp. HKCCD8929 TaxID=2683006 RepID=UPI00148919B0|nr:glycoside hydrolase family 65 protein [Ruegeria sp. HKCCD8929]
MHFMLSSSDWLIEETKFDLDEANFRETIFTVGNGYQGTRGSLEEGHKGELSGTYLAGVYDHHDSTVIDQVNAPTWLPLRVRVEGEALDVQTCKVIDHRRVLDLQTGLLHRDTLFEDSKGRHTRIASVRLASFADQHICGIRLTVTPVNHSSTITVESALDAQRYNLDRLPAYQGKPEFHPEVKWEKWAKSRHLMVTRAVSSNNGTYIEALTLDTGISIGMASTLDGPPESEFQRAERDYERVSQTVSIKAAQGQSYTFDKLVAIYTSRDLNGAELAAKCEASLESAQARGLSACLSDSAAVWRAKWDACDCIVTSDAEATRAMRFNIYHLLIAANENDPRANIGAKSMSGEGYKGHIFWDTEIFLLPFYIFTQPETAKALLKYRYYTMSGAIENAKVNGFKGAQYAWESADTGVETTPKWTADGANRIWTGEEEIHVTACVAFGILSYVAATSDRDFLRDFGAEVLYQTSRFWVSRLEWNDDHDRYELTCVIGPDEFHEHVDNNTFTNRMAKWHLEQTARVFADLSADGSREHEELMKRLGLTAAEVQRWIEVAGKIYIPFDPSRNLIEQFEGYFQLEDIPITEWDENHMPVYPEGHDHFSLNDSMLLKQPDVIMLNYLLPDEFSDEIKAANYAFYEKRTMHKSSLSPAIHSIMGIEVGDISSAHRYFERSASVDLVNNQGNTQDGMHIASAGGTWQSLVCGFGGFRVKHGKMTFKPWLPEQWTDIRFSLKWRGNDVAIVVAHDECRFLLTAPAGTQEGIEFLGRPVTLLAGEEVVFATAPA